MLPYVSFMDEGLSSQANAILNSLEAARPHLSATRSPSGGISRGDVVAAARPHLEDLGFSAPLTGEVRLSARTRDGSQSGVGFDAVHFDEGIAVTVHAGRAWTNHEAMVGVLRMSAAHGIRSGLVVVPGHYKSSVAAANVIQFLREMANWEGLWLDLEGVAVLSY